MDPGGQSGPGDPAGPEWLNFAAWHDQKNDHYESILDHIRSKNRTWGLNETSWAWGTMRLSCFDRGLEFFASFCQFICSSFLHVQKKQTVYLENICIVS